MVEKRFIFRLSYLNASDSQFSHVADYGGHIQIK